MDIEDLRRNMYAMMKLPVKWFRNSEDPYLYWSGWCNGRFRLSFSPSLNEINSDSLLIESCALQYL